jgi:hypothetical protein
MPARKRTRQEAETGEVFVERAPPAEPTKLDKLRNMWEFASLVQFLGIFGGALKLDGMVSISVRTYDQNETPEDRARVSSGH